MATILSELSAVAGAAFAAEGLPQEAGSVQLSQRPELGHFQCNGALAAAKEAGRNPREIAQAVAERLRADARFAEVSIAGPGFLNLSLTDGALADALGRLTAVPRAETPLTVILDFGGPNIAKPMHVGHLRSTIIGDSLQRLFRALGHHVVSDIHMGDWGKPIGLLIDALARERPDLPYFADGATGPWPQTPPVTMDDLERLYPQAAAAAKDDPARDEAARRATAELQTGRPGYRALWQAFKDVSVAGMAREFGALGVSFDEWKGEADADPLIAPMIAALKARGLAREDQGALIVDVAEPEDRKALPPLLLLKSDGAVLYETTDLATIVERVRAHDPDLVLYVVDQRQRDHFEKVFRAARRAGLSGRAALEHVGFGTMNGTDGKPFRTRAGGVMKLQDLIAMAHTEAGRRLAEAGLAGDLPDAERDEIARRIGVGAIKFADLQNHRTSNYVFDLERFTRFEGKTGPYLQYQAVRIRSLLRRAAEAGATPGAIAPGGPAERDLALAMLALPPALEEAAAKRAPNVICEALFALAQAFSRFYAAHHVLSEPDPARRASFLGLALRTAEMLEQGLSLLGIAVPEKM